MKTIILALLVAGCGGMTSSELIAQTRPEGPPLAEDAGQPPPMGAGGADVGSGGALPAAGGSPQGAGGKPATGGAMASSGGVVGAGGTLGSGGTVSDAGTDYCDPAVQCMYLGSVRCYGVMDCGHGQEIDCAAHTHCGTGEYCPNSTPPIVSVCLPK